MMKILLAACAALWLLLPLAVYAAPQDGSGWVYQSSPGWPMYSNQIAGMAAISPNDAWAIGTSVDGGGYGDVYGYAAHWDGSEWHNVVVDDHQDSVDTELAGVAALSSSDVWAVGNWVSGGTTVQSTLIEHYDGSRWQIVPSPNPAGSMAQLTSVSAASPTDIWAAGYYYVNGLDQSERTLIEHWDGSQWRIDAGADIGIPSVNFNLSGISATADGDVCAVGTMFWGGADNLTGQAVMMVRDPSTGKWVWQEARVGSAAVTELTGVTTVRGFWDRWAVGFTLDPATLIKHPVAFHWDGMGWQPTAVPGGGGPSGELTAVAALGPGDVFAVGEIGDQRLYKNSPFAVHWNGAAWSQVSAQVAPNSIVNMLTSLAIVPGTTRGDGGRIWAGGFQSPQGELDSRMTEIETLDLPPSASMGMPSSTGTGTGTGTGN